MVQQQFEDRDTVYAYRVLRDFFDGFSFCRATSYMESIIEAGINNRTWKGMPYNAMFFMENMTALCKAAFTIYTHNSVRENAIAEPEEENGAPDISLSKNFTRSSFRSSAWNDFPRHLTAKQYQNPYKAIKKFCKYTTEVEWNKIMKELTENALSYSANDELCYPYNILKVRLRLLQLIEACHLLDVRTGNKNVSQKNENENNNPSQ